MRRAGRGSGRGSSRSGRRLLGLLAWLLLLLGSLGVVTWRQTHGVALDRGLRELESERALVEAERVALERRIQSLGSRARVLRLARERLGMHLPADSQIVFLPMPSAEAQPADTLLLARVPR